MAIIFNGRGHPVLLPENRFSAPINKGDSAPPVRVATSTSTKCRGRYISLGALAVQCLPHMCDCAWLSAAWHENTHRIQWRTRPSAVRRSSCEVRYLLNGLISRRTISYSASLVLANPSYLASNALITFICLGFFELSDKNAFCSSSKVFLSTFLLAVIL